MTTIAWDGKMLAADTACDGSFVSYGHHKIVESHDGSFVYSICGAMTAGLAFASWHDGTLGTEDPLPFPEDVSGDWAVLVYSVYEETMMLYDGTRHGMEITAPFAIGSGSPYAQTAMVLGLDASEAVEVAILLDSASGGEVIAYNLALPEEGN